MGKFLSTPSARRATYWSALNILSYRYFYPRPPRGGRLDVRRTAQSGRRFLSTPSARRATMLAWLNS